MTGDLIKRPLWVEFGPPVTVRPSHPNSSPNLNRDFQEARRVEREMRRDESKFQTG